MSTDVAVAFVKQVMRRRFSPSVNVRSSVCRNLFGPIDHEETERTLADERQRMVETNSRRYNFNFELGKPLPGRYQWERVPTTNGGGHNNSNDDHGIDGGVPAPTMPIPMVTSPNAESDDGVADTRSGKDGRSSRSENVLCGRSRATLRELNEQTRTATQASTTAAADGPSSADLRSRLSVDRSAVTLAEATRHLSMSAAVLGSLAADDAQPVIMSTSRPQRQMMITEFMPQRKRSATESKSVSSSMATNCTPSKQQKTSP